eukprot:COSAG05_NODE_88_length_20344_cov_12.094690_3_plen_1505_part_00
MSGLRRGKGGYSRVDSDGTPSPSALASPALLRAARSAPFEAPSTLGSAAVGGPHHVAPPCPELPAWQAKLPRDALAPPLDVLTPESHGVHGLARDSVTPETNEPVSLAARRHEGHVEAVAEAPSAALVDHESVLESKARMWLSKLGFLAEKQIETAVAYTQEEGAVKAIFEMDSDDYGDMLEEMELDDDTENRFEEALAPLREWTELMERERLAREAAKGWFKKLRDAIRGASRQNRLVDVRALCKELRAEEASRPGLIRGVLQYREEAYKTDGWTLLHHVCNEAGTKLKRDVLERNVKEWLGGLGYLSEEQIGVAAAAAKDSWWQQEARAVAAEDADLISLRDEGTVRNLLDLGQDDYDTMLKKMFELDTETDTRIRFEGALKRDELAALMREVCKLLHFVSDCAPWCAKSSAEASPDETPLHLLMKNDSLSLATLHLVIPTTAEDDDTAVTGADAEFFHPLPTAWEQTTKSGSTALHRLCANEGTKEAREDGSWRKTLARMLRHLHGQGAKVQGWVAESDGYTPLVQLCGNRCVSAESVAAVSRAQNFLLVSDLKRQAIEKGHEQPAVDTALDDSRGAILALEELLSTQPARQQAQQAGNSSGATTMKAEQTGQKRLAEHREEEEEEETIFAKVSDSWKTALQRLCRENRPALLETALQECLAAGGIKLIIELIEELNSYSQLTKQLSSWMTSEPRLWNGSLLNGLGSADSARESTCWQRCRAAQLSDMPKDPLERAIDRGDVKVIDSLVNGLVECRKSSQLHEWQMVHRVHNLKTDILRLLEENHAELAVKLLNKGVFRSPLYRRADIFKCVQTLETKTIAQFSPMVADYQSICDQVASSNEEVQVNLFELAKTVVFNSNFICRDPTLQEWAMKRSEEKAAQVVRVVTELTGEELDLESVKAFVEADELLTQGHLDRNATAPQCSDTFPLRTGILGAAYLTEEEVKNPRTQTVEMVQVQNYYMRWDGATTRRTSNDGSVKNFEFGLRVTPLFNDLKHVKRFAASEFWTQLESSVPGSGAQGSQRVEPVCIAIRGAAAIGREGLLYGLLRFDDKVFEAEAVRHLVDFKWWCYGHDMFLTDALSHVLLLAAWTTLTMAIARSSQPVFAEIPSFNGWSATGLCVARGTWNVWAPAAVRDGTCYFVAEIFRCSLLLAALVLLGGVCPIVPVGIMCDIDSPWISFRNALAMVTILTVTARSIGREFQQIAGSISDIREKRVKRVVQSQQELHSQATAVNTFSSDTTISSIVGVVKEYVKRVIMVALGMILAIVLLPVTVRIALMPMNHLETIDEENYCWAPGKQCVAKMIRFFSAVGQGFLDYILDIWNLVDVTWLVLVVWMCGSLLGRTQLCRTTQLGAANTLLLWFRLVQYLSGFEATTRQVAIFVRMIYKVGVFCMFLFIFLIGNAFSLELLFPVILENAEDLNFAKCANWSLDTEDSRDIDRAFGTFYSSFFTSYNMVRRVAIPLYPVWHLLRSLMSFFALCVCRCFRASIILSWTTLLHPQ